MSCSCIRGRKGSGALELAEGFEQEFGAALGEGHVSQLIDDEQLIAGQLLLEAQQVFVIPRSFDQFADQGSCSGETHSMTTLACTQAKSQRDVRGLSQFCY
jgi:hypothetical protein